MPVDDNKDPQVDGTEPTSTESLTPETQPTIEEQATPASDEEVTPAISETQSKINPGPEATADDVEEGLDGDDDDSDDDDDEQVSNVKVLRKESTKVAVARTEDVKEEAVEIDEADQSGATGEAHDDFAWDAIAKIDDRYTAAEREAMEKEYEK
jgi:small subunit ribosomal protein S1